MRGRTSLLLAAAILSGCGKVADLEPAAGHALPQKPALASTTPDANELLRLPPYAAPQRVDELLKKGEKRKPDRFDLPPPDGAAAPTENQTPSTTGPDNAGDPKESTR